MTAKPLPVDYQAALEGSACYVIPQPGCLALGGRDRNDFLQRQTTNDIRLLNENSAISTVLTSPNARILDVLYILPGSDETILALTLPGQGSQTAAYFGKRIFFMDQVTVEDVSQAFTQIDLLGPCRAEIINQLGFTEQPQPDEILQIELEGQPVYLLNNAIPIWLGWRILFPSALEKTIVTILQESSLQRLTPETYQLLHLETGIPQVLSELNEDFTPLETGLAGAISESKGCYTGQEIIARQVNYDKITQRLCGIRLSDWPPAGNSVWVEDRLVGKVTSVGISPRFGPIGLAMIRRPYFEPATHVRVGEHPVQSLPASVCRLPFEL